MKLLLEMQNFFTCGSIVSKKTRSEVSFRVNSLHDLTNFIVPHFVNYPLLSQKAADFYLFKQTVDLINTKVHLTEVGIQQIINIRASMNLGLSDLQKSEFINYKSVPRPNMQTYTEIPNPNWIAGFSSAEGCFLVNISKSNLTKTGQIIQLIFKIYSLEQQHQRDRRAAPLEY